MPQERWATLKWEDPQLDPAGRFLFGKARERSAAALCRRLLGALVRYYDSDMYSITESRREPPFGAEGMPFDLSYWEALRAYWRYYWPPQLLVLFSVPLVKLFPALALVMAVPVVVIAFFGGWLFVSRLYSRPYRGFSLVIVETPEEVDVPRLTLGRVTKVWFFLWWRQIVAGACGVVLISFLRFLLSLGRLDFPQQIVPVAAVLAIGPILLKMLIGHPFSDFRLEARRAAKA